MKVCYDLTRLATRLEARHPTGIDRVDLSYALWTRSIADEWRGIVQGYRGVSDVNDEDADALLRQLRMQWLDGRSDLVAVNDTFRREGWARESLLALGEKLSRCSLKLLWQERGFGGTLLRLCPSVLLQLGVSFDCSFEDLDNEFVYWNIGHCFRFQSTLNQLKDRFGSRSVFFVHDVIPLTHPETQKPSSRAHFEQFMHAVGDFNGRVLTSSQATVEALSQLSEPSIDHLQNQIHSISVLPLAVESHFIQSIEAVMSASSSEPYFVCVGTIEPRKNIELLLSVWEALIADATQIPRLILVGKVSRFELRQRERLRRLEKLGVIEVRSDVEDSELIELMRNACALLFPSLAEGWGLPLVEALSLGVPVLASDIPVFREVGQSVPEFLSPFAYSAWKQMVCEYAQEASTLRGQQLERLKDYAPIRWEAHFTALRGALRISGNQAN